MGHAFAVAGPDVELVRTRVGRIAHQAIGDGPVEILVSNWVIGIVDLLEDEPHLARCLERLSTFSRHHWFDGRGRGGSYALPLEQARFIENNADDMLALLDALQLGRVVLLGLAGPPELLLAASHPDRVSALLLVNPSARWCADEGYPSRSVEELEQRLRWIGEEWGSGRNIASLAASLVDDRDARRWWAKVERLTCTVDDAYLRFRHIFAGDVRDAVSASKVLTLVVTSKDWALASQSRWVADHIDGARHIEVPGGDKAFFAGDTTPLLDAIEEFVTGRHPVPVPDRAWPR